MQLSPGEQLGPYQVTGLIGKGGMGEVYRATDTRLKRPVAIKTSNREFSDRFEREAHAIAALNHPNICTLYDVGANYLVMELVEGEVLWNMIERGPLPLDKALAYAIQIADALAAAHAKGIIHRDLKPGNIIITPNGAKVLDFGLAKLADERGTAASSGVETVAASITKAGAILGTLNYMAPEQVEGKEADARTDIFAFGVCIYEMITGDHPFNGDTQAAMLASILKDQPAPMNQRQPGTPRALERIVRRCLEKKPEERWNSARDLKAALETIDLDAAPLSTGTGTPLSTPITGPVPTASSRKWMWPVAAVVVLAALGYVGWNIYTKVNAPERTVRFQVTLPDNVQFSEYVRLSPDGHKLLFSATGAQAGLWIRDLETLEWRRVPGTEGGAVGPFWSPDSKYLVFSTGNELKKVDLAGSPPVTLCSSERIGTGTFSPDGQTILFGSYGSGGAIRRVAAQGGIPVSLGFAGSFPLFLSDGKHFLYTGAVGDQRGVFAASIDAKAEEQPRKLIVATNFNVPYVGGKLFFMRNSTLMAQPFDESKLELTGEPVPVAQNVGTFRATAMFSVSESGVLAFREGAAQTLTLKKSWYDRAGKRTATLADESPDYNYTLAPDGKTAVALAFTDQTTSQIPDGLWLFDLTRGVRTRFTFNQPAADDPVWSPNGARIYYSQRGALFVKDANGSGDAMQIKVDGNVAPSGISPDGRFLLVDLTTPANGRDVAVLTLEGEPKLVPLLATPAAEAGASFSPDGKWIAYASSESGRGEIYVRPFVASGSGAPKLGDGKWAVSKNAGFQPRWTKGGREVLFQMGSEIHSVPVTVTGPTLRLETESTLFDVGVGFGWDVTSDGQKFLIVTAPPPVAVSTQSPITVVLNWESDFKK